MPKYSYVAMDSRGQESKGTLEVASQNEAITRVKEMGLFPTKIVEVDKVREKSEKKGKGAKTAAKPGVRRVCLISKSRFRSQRKGKTKDTDHLHPAVGDTCGRGFAAIEGPACVGKTGEKFNAQIHYR